MDTHLMHTYARKPIAFTRGEGVWLYTDTDEDERYLDALSGIAVCGLGHAHPNVVQAISDQSSKLIHTSNIYTIDLQQELASKLCSVASMDAAFFCNSGAEANEAAIKLAKVYGHHKNIKSPSIIVMENSFHGRTMATLTATGNRKAHAGFEPLVPGFIRAPYNDIHAIQSILNNNTDVAAILLEPIQGEGGINIPDSGYLSEIRKLCDDYKIIMMLDEVQTGNGRTGRWFCYQHEDVQPDVVTVAKGLANGVPIGACLAKSQVADLFAPGSHGSTFGGNLLACRAGLATIQTIESDHLCENATQQGQYILKKLGEKFSNNGHVLDIRGKGLMIGIELDSPCSEIVDLCLEHRLLVNVTANNVIRLLPPLILEQAHADTIVEIVATCINKFTQSK